MNLSVTVKLQRSRAVFALIVLLVLARSAVAFHDSVHIDLIDDHCQIVQLAKNTTSSLPNTDTLDVEWAAYTLSPDAPPRVALARPIRPFAIRAPPTVRS